MFTGDICLIDFGESYQVAFPPEDLGIPTPYCSPELLFDHKAGIPSDLWALACTLFEIVTARRLFPDMDGDGEDVILQWVQILGRMPDEWWVAWESQGEYFDEAGHPLTAGDGSPLAQHVSLETCLEQSHTITDSQTGAEQTLKISEDDVKMLSEMLSKVLRYNSEERASIGDLLESTYWEQFEAPLDTSSQDTLSEESTSQKSVSDEDSSLDNSSEDSYLEELAAQAAAWKETLSQRTACTPMRVEICDIARRDIPIA